MLRTLNLGNGVTAHVAVCAECRSESGFLTEGVAHADNALNVVMPRGWLSIPEYTGRGTQRIMRDYCPRCAVAPEYRR
jgi:hypothetical protein